MAQLVFEMQQSLDGYVDHLKMGPPPPALFRHFLEQVRKKTGSVYGRRIYEIMRYWDDDLPDWDAEERDFAAVWRSQPKWVVSRSLKSVGPNATLVENDFEAVIRGLKAQLVGEIAVAGPNLAGSLTDLGLIDEYRLYLRPIVLGRGQPFFAGPRPPLRLVASDLIGEDVIRFDVRSCLIARLARRTAPPRQVRFGSKPEFQTETCHFRNYLAQKFQRYLA
jgi:dihydrofolate reductase